MPIKITGEKVKVDPNPENIFIRKVVLIQERVRDNAVPITFDIEIQCEQYGVDADGLRDFGEPFVLRLEDVPEATVSDIHDLTKDALEALTDVDTAVIT